MESLWQSSVTRSVARRWQTQTLLSAKFVVDSALPASACAVSDSVHPAHAYPQRPAPHRLTTRCGQRRVRSESTHDRHCVSVAGPIRLPVAVVLPLTGMYRVLAGVAARSVLAPAPAYRRNTPSVYQPRV